MLKSLLKRLNNTGTIVAIASAIILILNELGFGVDSEKIMSIINAICYVLITLGILNDSTSKGMYVPGLSDRLANELKEENKIEEDNNPKDF